MPGVGHKTASVVMSQGFGYPAFPVDTHIHRLAQGVGSHKWQECCANRKGFEIYISQKNIGINFTFKLFGMVVEFCKARDCYGITCKICKAVIQIGKDQLKLRKLK